MENQEIIKKTATETIKIESKALSGLMNSINQSFVEAVLSIYNASGRLVVTGIGKSAIVGQKIVATMNSTGTPSLFMHAADAIHGDLGMIRQEDVVMCISKSGDTPEIKVLSPMLKQLGSTLIAMTANEKSYLASISDHLVHTPCDQEADPNNLAPTTSTTLQMVMGDAMAVALLSIRGFSPTDFATYHPGGSLGKQLYLRVHDLMIKNEKPMVTAETPWKDVLYEISSKRLGATAVVNNREIVVGIITDGDLRRNFEVNTHVNELQAKDFMSASPKSLDSNEMAAEALKIMRLNSISQLVVTKDGIYAGMIHIHDLLREGLI
jgi:arabinose-5-phosphate isomerase